MSRKNRRPPPPTGRRGASSRFVEDGRGIKVIRPGTGEISLRDLERSEKPGAIGGRSSE